MNKYKKVYNINEILNKIIEDRFCEVDYNNLTLKLLYEDYSYEEAVKNGVLKISKKQIF